MGTLDLIGAYKRGELALDKNAKRIFESCFLCLSASADAVVRNVVHNAFLRRRGSVGRRSFVAVGGNLLRYLVFFER